MQDIQQYDIEAVKRFVRKNGLTTALMHFSNPNLSPKVKEDLVKNQIIVNGFPNVSLISSLA